MDLNAKMQKARESGYSDAEIKAYIGRSTPNPTRSAPKVGGVKGMLLNFLPTIASGAGAVIGGAAGSLLPGAGTVAGGVAGGALGGGVGEYLRQRLSGEAQDGIDKGNIVQESAFGALPGVLKGAKVIKGAKAAKLAEEALQAEQVASKTARASEVAGKLVTGSQASAGVDDYLRQLESVTQNNSLARQNIQRLAQEQSSKGILLGESGNSGVLVKPGATPSFASEGVTLQKVPSKPYVPTASSTARVSTPQSTESAYTIMGKKNVLDKTRAGLAQAEAKGLGIEVGATNRGSTLLPDQVDELVSFRNDIAPKYGGIKAGKPLEQAKEAQNVFKNVTAELKAKRAVINRDLLDTERQQIVDNIKTKVANNGSVTGTTKQADKLIEKASRAKTIDDIEELRIEADNIAYKKSGDAKTTSSAAQAHDVRDAIDEFVAPLSEDYAQTKKHYQLAKTLTETTAKSSKQAKGFKIFGNEVGQQTISGSKNKIVDIAKNIVGDSVKKEVNPISGFRPFMGATSRASIPQAGVRAAGSAFGIPFVGSPPQEEQAPQDMNFQEDIITDVPQETQGGVFSDPAKVEQAYFEALQSGNTKTADAILKGYEIFGKTGGSGKPESAESKKTTSNALAGLEAIASLKNTIATDPGALKKTAIPGRGLFSGAVGNVLGTASIDSSRQQIIDVIARLRTGAAISKTEEERFNKFIPQAFDSPEVQAEKLGYLERQFARVAQRSGGAGTDLESAVGL